MHSSARSVSSYPSPWEPACPGLPPCPQEDSLNQYTSTQQRRHSFSPSNTDNPIQPPWTPAMALGVGL